MTLQEQVVAWHVTRFPAAEDHEILAKAMEELGEVARAYNGRGDIIAEAADVIICMFVLIGRYHGADLLRAVEDKLAILTNPQSGHRSALT